MHAVCCPAGGPSVPGEPSPARQRPRPRGPSRHPTCQWPLSPRTAPNGPAPPARRPPPANGKPVARQRAHLNGPIRRPSPSPSLYGDRGMRSLIRPPASAGCPAHSLPEAPPTLSSARRAREKRPSAGGGKWGGKKGRGGKSPAAGSASSGRKGGQLEWKIPGRRPRVASAALPHGPAAPLLASPGFLLESQPASLYGRHLGRAAGRELGSLPWTLPVGAAAPRSGAFGCPRRGRAAPFGDPRCAPAAGRPRLSAHCSSGPSLSPPSSASRPSLLPPQVPPSLVTGAV